MAPTTLDFTHERTAALVRLATVLQHFDSGRLPFDAGQYQAIARQLTAALRRNAASPALQAVLDASPVAAELYENLHYEQAGLARSPLEQAVAAELEATQVLARVRR
jgi:hypothetical protein